MRDHKRPSLCAVSSAGLADTFVDVSIEEHGMALVTVPPARLRQTCLRNVVRHREVVALSLMLTSRSASSLVGITVIEHGVALLAVAPVLLRVGSFERVERQAVVEAMISVVRATRRASPFAGITVVEELEAFGAPTPIRLIGHFELVNAERGECVRNYERVFI